MICALKRKDDCEIFPINFLILGDLAKSVWNYNVLLHMSKTPYGIYFDFTAPVMALACGKMA